MIFLLLLSTFAFAGNNEFKGRAEDYKDLKGLGNASLGVNVSNGNMIKALNQFTERNQNRFRYCDENCSVNITDSNKFENSYSLRINAQRRFLFWNVHTEENLEVFENGGIFERNTNFWKKMECFKLLR